MGLTPSLTQSAQLCVCVSINNIPDHDGHVHTYVHHENRSLIQSLALMHSAIMQTQKTDKSVLILFSWADEPFCTTLENFTEAHSNNSLKLCTCKPVQTCGQNFRTYPTLYLCTQDFLQKMPQSLHNHSPPEHICPIMHHNFTCQFFWNMPLSLHVHNYSSIEDTGSKYM